MKKLLFLFCGLLAIGSLFQSCDDTKTYAEMLEDERNAVSKFIREQGIQVISQDEFERNGNVTDLERNEYVSLSDGVYMQIVDAGSEDPEDAFVNNDEICVRFVEQDLLNDGAVTCFNIYLEEYADANQYYIDPAVFRYTLSANYAYGTFIQLAYAWSVAHSSSTEVPSGWLLALPFVGNNAHVRLIVPSSMGISEAQSTVTPYYYDIQSFSKALN